MRTDRITKEFNVEQRHKSDPYHSLWKHTAEQQQKYIKHLEDKIKDLEKRLYDNMDSHEYFNKAMEYLDLAEKIKNNRT